MCSSNVSHESKSKLVCLFIYVFLIQVSLNTKRWESYSSIYLCTCACSRCTMWCVRVCIMCLWVYTHMYVPWVWMCAHVCARVLCFSELICEIPVCKSLTQTSSIARNLQHSLDLSLLLVISTHELTKKARESKGWPIPPATVACLAGTADAAQYNWLECGSATFCVTWGKSLNLKSCSLTELPTSAWWDNLSMTVTFTQLWVHLCGQELHNE